MLREVNSLNEVARPVEPSVQLDFRELATAYSASSKIIKALQQVNCKEIKVLKEG